MRSLGLFLLRYVLIACLIAAAVYSFVLARAAWLFAKDTATSVPAAVRLVPNNSDYLSRLAAWRNDERLGLLHRAVEVNDFDFQSWIQLGFLSEFQQHDVPLAEKYFLKAAAVNHMYLPRWTLANFYFRHDNETEFFRWAKAALAITPFAPEPIFAQMWLMSQDAARINSAIPDRPRMLLPYAWHLSNNGQNALIPQVVRRLVGAVGTRDPRDWGRDDLIAAIEDRLVFADAREAALDVWATLVKARWLPVDIPSGESPVTNGLFRTRSYRHGFDWTFPTVIGARAEQIPSEAGVRLYFSGDEPERCVLLEQIMPTEAGRLYQLSWQASSPALSNPSGLMWRVSPVHGVDERMSVSGDLLSAANWNWDFRAPAGSNLSRLSLEYVRPLGSLRARGVVKLSRVSAVLR